MNKVKVISGYVPLPVLHLDRAAYKALGDRMVAAVGPKKCRIFMDYPLEMCWFYPIVQAMPNVGLADKGHYPERFAKPEDLMLSNIVQHQRTTWAMQAAGEDLSVDVIVWLDYGILKQGGFTGKPVTEAAIAEFIAKVEQMDLSDIPFPGIWDKGPIDQNGGVNWRFCGSTHIWPVQHLPAIHRAYRRELSAFVTRNNTVPNDLPIWAAVEANYDLPFRWYKANHDATQLTAFVPKRPLTPLCALSDKFGSDKHNPAKYTPVYYDLLKGRKVETVLEIGICAQRDIPNHRAGASLWMWAEFFPEAWVYGVDIDPASMVLSDRIHSILADQSNKTEIAMVGSDYGPFDLIIDDGSHNPIHQLVSMHALLPSLRKGGVYVIEDIGNWQFPSTRPEHLAAQVPHGFRTRVFGEHPHQLLVIEHE